MRLALCPQCYEFTNTVFSNSIDHFTVEHCARLILESDTISCKAGFLIPLKFLVPELLIEELPQKYHIDRKDLEVNYDNFLGRGVSGSVYKGKYGDTDVAVKYYHDSQNHPMITGLGSVDSGRSTLSLKNDQPNLDETPESGAKSKVESDQSGIYENYKNLIAQPYDMDEAKSIKVSQ